MTIIDFLKLTFMPPKNPEQIARAITEKIANYSINLFKNDDFRRMNNFDKIDTIEQDRIFNEILVSGIAITIFIFETLGNRTNNNRVNQFYAEMKIELESSYPNWLRELGSKESDAALWKDLIKMRVDEYENDYQENRKEIQKRTKAAFAYVFVVAIGGGKHIARSKKKIMDNIFKQFLRWNTSLTDEILKILEKTTH